MFTVEAHWAHDVVETSPGRTISKRRSLHRNNRSICRQTEHVSSEVSN